MLVLLKTLLGTYLLCLLLVFVFQRQLIYFPERTAPALLDQRLRRSGLQAWPTLQDWRGLVSTPALASAKGTVLVFHGNAGLAADRLYYSQALEPLGYRVVLAEYPGYATRPGSLSEKALVADAISTAQLVRAQFPGKLWLCGESLGAGVAAAVIESGQVPVDGLLLVTPFASLAGVAQHHYWFFLARWLVLDRFDNIANLSAYRGKVAVIAAGQDEVVTFAQTKALYDALAAPKKLWRFDAAGHNSLPVEPTQTWWREAMQFLDG